MNLSNKGLADSKDTKLSTLNKVTSLNPSAAEFVPSAFKYAYGISKSSYAKKLDLSGSSKKAVLDRSDSNTSNNSDDEVHQYWHHQLPDDITPDFEVIGEELHEPGHLRLESLSIHDGVKQSKFSALMTGHTFDMHQDLASFISNNVSLGGKIGYFGSIHAEEHSSATPMMSTAMWQKPFINREQQQEVHPYDGDYSADSVVNLIGDSAFLEHSVADPVEFLSLQFPGFSVQSLADVYYGNGCDLKSTIELLTQLELQVDGSFGRNLNSKSLATPNFSLLDFPSLPLADHQNGLSKDSGEDVQHGSDTYRSPSRTSGGDIDFASAVRKLALQDSGRWRYDRKSSADSSAGSSRSSQQLASSYNSNSKMVYGDKWHSSGAAPSSPVWLKTGEAVANIYSESREDAHDFARLRYACFEQATQAYLIGNKALAKELSLKGQLYSMQMKAAHEKAKETIYQKRNPLSPGIQGYNLGQDPPIDLHGLHVSEATQILSHELRTLRSTARATGQRLHVMICVGTGHHTKGSRTPARLPVAVEQYLLKEGLPFTQPQPGLLCVAIC